MSYHFEGSGHQQPSPAALSQAAQPSVRLHGLPFQHFGNWMQPKTLNGSAKRYSQTLFTHANPN